MTATALDLLARHAGYLAARAISDEVAAARGYRSIGRAEARELGFTDSQAQPGLLIPLYRVDGEPGGYQLHPDQPRTTKDSKEIKYENPRKQKNVLDVNPLVREAAFVKALLRLASLPPIPAYRHASVIQRYPGAQSWPGRSLDA